MIFLDSSLAGAMPQLRRRRARGADARRAGRARGRARLRGADRRVATPRSSSPTWTSARGGHVLHERHDRAAEGRRLLAPLDRPALAVRRGCPTRWGSGSATRSMPVVPMFHAIAWGLPVRRRACRARARCCPGPDLTPAGARRPDRLGAGHARPPGSRRSGSGILELDPAPDLSSLSEVKAGGSAVPESLIRAFDERFGVPIVQGWGMTETSPLAAVSRLPAASSCPRTRRTSCAPPRGGSCRSSTSGSTPRPAASCTSAARGSRAATTATSSEGYEEKFTEDGWLRTGDVAELRRGSYIRLVDRTKDLVKSGGEWISSVDARERGHGPPRRASRPP